MTARLFLYNHTRRAQYQRQRVFLRLVKGAALLSVVAFVLGFLQGGMA